MSDEAGRLVFSRDPSGTFIDGMVFGTSGGGESVSATQRAGCMRAAPIRRSCPHTPMYVGLIVPSSCLTTAGTL